MKNGCEEILLFDPAVLSSVDWESRKASYRNGVSVNQPGQNLKLRPLQRSDHDRGYLQLLSQLTKVGEVTEEVYYERFDAMKSCPNTYYVTVLEDTESGSLIGAASLVVEQKFIHSASFRGRIEDVVVNENYRGLQLGKLLVEAMTLLGKSLGCYKMSLECNDDNIKFYENFGYKVDDHKFMVQRYKD